MNRENVLDAIGRSISICKSIPLTVWKWPDERRYSGVLPPVPENFRRAFLATRLTAPASPRIAKGLHFMGVEAVVSKIKYILISEEHALKNVRSNSETLRVCTFLSWKRPLYGS